MCLLSQSVRLYNFRVTLDNVTIWICVHRDCRVVKDMATGKSKGYGFVSFFNKWVSASLTPLECSEQDKGHAGAECFVFDTTDSVVSASSGRRKRHPADGWAVAGRQADQNQLGHTEACSQDYQRKYVVVRWGSAVVLIEQLLKLLLLLCQPPTQSNYPLMRWSISPAPATALFTVGESRWVSRVSHALPGHWRPPGTAYLNPESSS